MKLVVETRSDLPPLASCQLSVVSRQLLVESNVASCCGALKR